MYRDAFLKRSLCYLICLLCIPFGSAVADILTWTDEHGEVHYGDSIPEEYRSQAEKIHVRDTNTYSHDEAVDQRFQVSTEVPETSITLNKKQELVGSNDPAPRAEADCQRDYGMSCDRVDNWQRYAVEECEEDRNGRRCEDPEFLALKYKPRTIDELKKQAIKAARANRKREQRGESNN